MSKNLRDGRVGSLNEASLAVPGLQERRSTGRLLNGCWRENGLDDSSKHQHSVRISCPRGSGAANSLVGGYDGSGQSVKRALTRNKAAREGGRSYTCVRVAFRLRKEVTRK